MCGCDWNYVCLSHRGTPADPFYLDDEPSTPQEEADLRRGEHTDAVVLPGLRA